MIRVKRRIKRYLNKTPKTGTFFNNNSSTNKPSNTNSFMSFFGSLKKRINENEEFVLGSTSIKSYNNTTKNKFQQDTFRRNNLLRRMRKLT